MGNIAVNTPNTRARTAPAAAPEQDSGGLSLMGITPARLMKVPLKHWKFSALLLVICTATALANGLLFAKPTYTSMGKLLYDPRQTEGLSVPQNVETIMELLKQQSSFEQLGKEVGMEGFPAELWAKFFDIKKAADNTNVIDVKYKSEDRALAPKVINTWMELACKERAAQRHTEVTLALASTDLALKKANKQLEDAREAERVYIRDKKLATDPKTLWDGYNDAIKKAEDKHLDASNQYQRSVKRIKTLEEQITDLVRVRTKGGATPDPAVAEEIEAMKLPLLRTHLEDKAALDNANGELANKTKEYETAKSLFYNPAGNLITEPTFNKAKNDFKSAERTLKTAQDKLALTVKQLNDLKLGSQEIRDLRKRQRDEVDNQQSLQREIDTYADQLETKRKERDRIEPIKKEWEAINDSITSVRDQLKFVGDKRTALNLQLQNVGNQLTISSRARPDLMPFSDRNKKIGLGFIVPLLIGLGAMLALEMATKAWRAESLAERLRLPVLAHSSRGGLHKGTAGSLSGNESRALALRIRQFVPDTGGVVLISSLNEGNGIDRLLVELSRFLAMRDEQVLILDARIANAQAECLPALVERRADGSPLQVVSSDDLGSAQEVDGPGLAGLAQYLVFEGQHSASFVYRTRLHGVDYMPSGGPYPITDALASEPMAELLKILRKSYTLTLVVGPAVSRSVDTEILAAFVDGVIVVINEPLGQFSTADEEFFHSLREKNAPLLGSVICV